MKVHVTKEWFQSRAHLEEGQSIEAGALSPVSVLFLDVDGVLNQCGKSNQGLMTEQCDRLADICRQTGCKVVVSSTWRRYPRLMEDRLLPMFRSRGIECIGQTPMLEKPSPGGLVMVASARHEEITAWLADHPEVKQYAIVDDDKDADDGAGRYVRTDSYEGLLDSHAAALICLLSPVIAELRGRSGNRIPTQDQPSKRP